MPKLITKHRRGTTAQWRDSNIIIEEGELVVEECEDGFAKLKLGDGKHTFSGLPYITKQIERSINEANSRIDHIVAINEGDITSDDPLYEIVDVRIGHDGVTYSSAGSAVRAIGEDVSNLRSSLQQFINADAVDGLFYENNLLYLTADGVIVSDPVEILGGSGGGGSSSSVVIKLKSLHTSNTFSVTANSTVYLEFNFTSTEDDVPTGDGTCNIQVGGVSRKKLTIKQGNNKVDITDYIEAGDNSVRVTCTDIYGNSRSLVYNISVIDLSIKSTFNPYITYNKSIDFRYSVEGLISKTVYFEVDGDIVAHVDLTASSSGKESSQVLPITLFTHGVHKLDVYASAELEDGVIESNHLVYDVMIALPSETSPMIASVLPITQISEGELLSIPYIVYDPNDAICEVTLQVSYLEKGVEKTYSTTTVEVNQSLQYWNTRQFPAANSVMFTIMYEDQIKTHTIKVTESSIDVEAEDGAKLYLSAKGRSNSESNPSQWSYNGIDTLFTGFNWISNGWMQDERGDTCLRLSGGATAEIAYYPFNNLDSGLATSGRTIEFEFAIRDISNRDTVVINCYQERETDETVKTVGIKATADKAILSTTKNEVACNYKDLEKIRVAFTIDGKTEGSSKFISCYLDGVLSSVLRYTEEDSFNNTAKIKLGDSGCTLDLYTIRIYDRALTAKEILTNYIADTTDMGTKLTVYTDNDIYDATGKLSYEKLKTKIPTITFTGQMPTYKGDKRVVKMDFENPFDSSKNFSNVYGGPIDVEIDVQGTSSQFYVRKNWKIKLDVPKKGISNAPYQHMDNELPSTVFCIKVDYAEATGTHNTQNANFVETLYSQKVPAQLDDARVRTTITGFPCVIFEKETEESTPVFSSKGNFNFDKDSEDAFGFNDNYDVECWEFCNNTSDACNFLAEIPADWKDDFEPRYTAFDFGAVEDLQEVIDEGTATDAEKEEIIARRTEMIARFKRMHDWVLSTRNDIGKFKAEFEQYFDLHYSLIYYLYTFVALMVDQRAKNMFLTYWSQRVEKGGNGNWIIGGIDTGIYAANTDKPYVENDEWYIDGNSTGIVAGKWYPYFYDNDTSYGINNTGYLTFDYYHEDIDQINTGANVYNGQNSTLWVNFRQAFSSEIKDMYAQLRSDKLLTYDRIVNQFIEEGSSRYSASVYNEDAEYKYLSMARPENVDTIDDRNLYQVKGDGEHHLKYFVQNRFNYCDSKWYAGTYPDNAVTLRINTPTLAEIPEDATAEQIAEINAANDIISGSLAAVPANPTITVTPFSDMYCGVRYKANGTLYQKRVKMNTPASFGEDLSEVFNDTETAIYGASELSSLGDLSGLYCGALDISKAAKLSYLQLGSKKAGYSNANLKSVTFSTSPLLKTIDISNCTGLQGSLNLEGCSSVEELYALGTRITGVSFANSGYLNTLELPSTIDSLTLRNQHNLYTENISIGEEGSLNTNNLTKLTIVNCPNVDGSAILTSCLKENGQTNLTNVYITDVNWTVTDWTQLRKLYLPSAAQVDAGEYVVGENGNYFKVDVEGNQTDTTIPATAGTGYGLHGIDLTGQNVDYINITGNCVINQNLLGSDMAELIMYLPYLKFSMGDGYKLTSTVYFMSDDGQHVLHEEVIETSETSGVVCPDPVANKYTSEPYREATVSHVYVYAGWSRNSSIDRLPQADALKNIVGDRILYPAFNYTLNRYPVEFYNQSTLLQRVEDVLFYETAEYTQSEPLKYPEDVTLSELYPFATWLPSPTVVEENIVDGVVKCYAQFKTIDEQWEIPTLAELKYTTDDAAQTIAINGRTTEWNDQPNVFVAFDSHYNVENKGEYIVQSIAGFNDFDTLQLVKIPETVEYFKHTTEGNVTKGAFENCPKLQNAVIPRNIKDIGLSTYANCNRLNEVQFNAVDSSLSKADYSTSPFRGCASVDGFNLIISKDVTTIPAYTFNQPSIASGLKLINKLIWEPESKCTKIGTYAFARAAIEEFSLPDSITEIGSYAFQRNNRVKELTLPSAEGLKVGISAFEDWEALETLRIPNGVEEIEPGAFSNTPKLTAIYSDSSRYIVPESQDCLIDTRSNSLLLGSLTGVVPEGIRKIDNFAFSRKPILSVSFPESLTAIGQSAFTYCQELKEIVVPDSVESIGSQAFYRCSGLQNITLPKQLSQLSTYVIAYSSALKSLSIPASVTVVGAGALRAASGLISLTFEDGSRLETIQGQAFAECLALTSVEIPNTVTTIDARAFESCTHLTSVYLPNNLTKLNAGTFSGCKSLTEIRIPDSVTTISSYENDYTDESKGGAFYNCSSLQKVYLGAQTLEISPYTFVGCDEVEIHTPLNESDLPEDWGTGWGATNFTIVYNSTGV